MLIKPGAVVHGVGHTAIKLEESVILVRHARTNLFTQPVVLDFRRILGLAEFFLADEDLRFLVDGVAQRELAFLALVVAQHCGQQALLGFTVDRHVVDREGDFGAAAGLETGRQHGRQLRRIRQVANFQHRPVVVIAGSRCEFFVHACYPLLWAVQA